MLEWFYVAWDRLERAWRALIDEPRDVAGIAGRADILLTGPLPTWMHRAFVAKARQMRRPVSDVIYVALRIQAQQLIAEASQAPAQKEEKNIDEH